MIDILDPEKERAGEAFGLRPISSGKETPERRHETNHELVEEQHCDDGSSRQREGHPEDDGDEGADQPSAGQPQAKHPSTVPGIEWAT